MSQWRCKTDDGEQGPVSFQELAELVREGKVKEGALVRREGASNWEPAWHVPGLFRAAGIVEAGDSPLAPENNSETSHGPSAQPTRPAARAKLPAPSARGMASLAAGAFTAAFFYWAASRATTAFPIRPTMVDGEIVDSYFPFLGYCTTFESGVLYIDAFVLSALGAWSSLKRLTQGAPRDPARRTDEAN